MFVDHQLYMEFLYAHKMTARQFLYCYLLGVDQQFRGRRKTQETEGASGWAHLYKYAANIEKYSRKELSDLVERGYLVELPRVSQTDPPDHYEATPLLMQILFAPKEYFDEFFDSYPSMVPNFKDVGGPPIRLKVTDVDALRLLYRKKVANKAMHERVMKALSWDKKAGRINMNIEKWVSAEMWRTSEEDSQRSRPSEEDML